VELPRKSEMTSSIVQWVHLQLDHCTSESGITTTLRKGFWISRMYEYVRIPIRHSVECQCSDNKPAGQVFGDLPKKIVHGDPSESLDVWIWGLLISLRADHMEVPDSRGVNAFVMESLRLITKQGCSTMSLINKEVVVEYGEDKLLYCDPKIKSLFADEDCEDCESRVET
jgi:hypothetical protein